MANAKLRTEEEIQSEIEYWTPLVAEYNQLNDELENAKPSIYRMKVIYKRLLVLNREIFKHHKVEFDWSSVNTWMALQFHFVAFGLGEKMCQMAEDRGLGRYRF